ncbi:hypothetical protein G647_05432 [Cladophialophora carrionii CBS 160.54]|uniref:Poly [ADP-ribose] polymerase n=1 Tax=Cladophialophora carrionii CBS 160.54 TaxID=1279043 RepID=V9D9W0_9EURO|nr:uncharacterized protein G647_05432 [Cladophialophora carrionii CBS 160.54]ETI23630.1 hypothetical protein G647_05432 [Cladophialophora carrionii CBS 160.54]
MPRIKAPPKSAVPSLDGVTISFASYTPNAHPELGNKSVAQLKIDISNCGGSYTTKPSDCTHLIASQAQFDKKIDRIKQAEKHPHTSIVSYEWLVDSLASSNPVSVDAYLLGDPEDSSSNDADPLKINQSQPPRKASAAKKASKRTRQQDDEEEDNLQPAKKSRQSDRTKAPAATAAPTAKSDIKVPVDQQVPSASDYTVYIDDDGVIYDATLNKSDAGANNNKFYRVQVLEANNNFKTWTRWGRVGDRGQTKWLGDGDHLHAISQFKTKFKEKSGIAWEDRDGPSKKGKYVYLEVNYEDSDAEDEKETPVPDQDDADEEEQVLAESKLDPPVQRLMELIFNVQFFNATMAELDYDANKMPLGKLSKKTLLKGYEVLKDLASLVADPTLAATMGESQHQAVADRSNQYFSLVPHVVGRRKAPVLHDMDSIRREIRLLEALTDMQLANEIMKSASVQKQKDIHVLDARYQGLGMKEMTPLTPTGSEYSEISNYLTKSVGGTHNIRYTVQDIFRIERNGEFDRLDKSAYAKLGARSDRRLLWHGSRASNFGGILSQGLRIAPPEAPVSGYMFGKGVYLADMSSKSAGYCASGISGGTGILLLCEAELGAPMLELTGADYHAGDRCKQEGRISTWGKGSVAPQAWKDAACIHPSLKGVKMPDVVSKPPGPTNVDRALLMYNEYIVYDVAQIKLRYLLRVSMI